METSRLTTRTFLLCPPAHYEAHFMFNPWMDYREEVDRERAWRQWETLKGALEAAGARTVCIEPRPESPAMVFTRDAALPLGPRRVLLMRNDGPRGCSEPDPFARWFRERGVAVESLPPGHRLDGGNVIPAGPGRCLVGVKPGVGGKAERYLARLLRLVCGVDLLAVPLRARRFAHLDMALGDLGGRAWLLHPGAFRDVGAVAGRRRLWLGRPVIEVSESDAHAFGCNALAVDGVVLTGAISRRLAAEIRRFGFEVERLELGEFHKAGGGARCLCLGLDPPWRAGADSNEQAGGG